MKKYSLDFDRIEWVGLTCTCTVSGEDMPSPTQKRFHGLNFFRWGEHGAERFIAEYRPATLNKIRLLHLEFEQEKPVATHKSASGAKKWERAFFLQAGGSTTLWLEADTFGVSEPKYRFDYDASEYEGDVLNMGHPVVSATYTVATMGITTEAFLRDGFHPQWRTVKDEYINTAKALDQIKNASEQEPLFSRLRHCLARMNAIKAYWSKYSVWTYETIAEFTKEIPGMSEGARVKKLEQLVAVADSYLDKKCGSLYKDDLRVHIGIMWALWESFNGAKPDTLGVDERILEELVIELLGV